MMGKNREKGEVIYDSKKKKKRCLLIFFEGYMERMGR